MLTPACRKTKQKQFFFECQSAPLPDTLKSNFIPWLLQFSCIKVILWITLIYSQYCHLAARASERYGYVFISIQLPMEYKPQHKAEIWTAQLLQWSHTSSSMPPLPQIKPFLQITLCPVNRNSYDLCQQTPRYKGAVLLSKKHIEISPH